MSTSTLQEHDVASAATPRVRTSLRRAVFWIIAAVFAILIVVVSLLATRGASIDADELSAGNSTPNGGRALAQVLRQQGVDVVESTTLATTLASVGQGGGTVLLYDPAGYLDEAQLESLAALHNTRLVVVTPRDDALSILAPGVAFGGTTETDDVLPARCDVGPASRAGKVTGGWTLYSASQAQDASGCFIGPFGAAGVVSLDDGRVTVVGSANAFTNGVITKEGNAALGLGLLGATDRLVWYLPSINDVAVSGPPSLEALTPGWVAPVTGIVVITAIAAMLWRGRRFGPLVIENLPVTVRASETMEGRARLYQRSSNRSRALDALRIGTVTRLSGIVGLSRHASVPEIAATVAGLTGRDPWQVRSVLLDATPSSDADLVALSDQLLDLEAATRRAIDLTERTTQ
ncbi:DUF4350 domain-containing protein [Plantibacter sp. Mn2098]|uniref:DUF4350 domain-containing protein n=1 Tax=Plantibacter sp. Mn2098 TaxID=3395266 RepID=UPI003BC42682